IAGHWLTQAMLNLIANAGESIPEGRRRGHISITAAPGEGDVVRISVKDNGRGMAPEVQRRAFDLFYTTKSRSMGKGLGLPLAKKVAVRAGGSIELISQPGRGTTAVLILPATERSSARAGGAGRRQRAAAISIRNYRVA